MHVEFPNRRVIVAGAARGMGRAITQAFAERGAQVWAGDLLREEIEPLAGARPGGGQVHAAQVDVTDAGSIERMVASAARSFEGARHPEVRARGSWASRHPEVRGAKRRAPKDGWPPHHDGTRLEGRAPPQDGVIDILVYVAGGVRGQSATPVEGVSLEDWRAIVDANLTGAFLFAKAVAPGMKRAGYGRIVTISSRAALATSLTGIQSYTAAKHGQLGLVRQLAQELGPFGVTVNSVAPGFMPTSPDYERQWAGYDAAFRTQLIDRIAMRRMGTPEDIAHAVMFLASDYASWITGQVLPVTGSPIA